MTWQSTVNIGPTDADEGIFELKALMKANSWNLLGSGDGDSNFSNSGSDVITGFGSGPNGIANTNAWWRIQSPDLQREYLFYRNTGLGDWELRYSESAGFTGGAPGPNTPPTATDEEVAFSGFSTANGTVFFHMAIQDTPLNGIYSFWWVGREQTTGNNEGFCYANAVDLARSGDDDPVVQGGHTSSLAPSIMDADGNLAPQGFYDHGGSDEQFVAWGTMDLNGVVANLGVDGDGNDTLIPIPIARGNLPRGLKGIYAYHRWKGVSGRAYPDIIDDGTEVYLVCDDMCLQGWPSTATAPSI